MADLNKGQNLYEKSEQLYKKVLKLKAQSLGKQHPKYAVSLGGLGGLYYQKGEYSKAELYYDQGLEILKKQQLNTSKSYIQLMLHIGSLYMKQKKFSQAEKLFDEVKGISDKQQLTQGKDYLTTVYYLAYAYIFQGKSDNAMRLIEDITKLDNVSDADKASIIILKADLYREQAHYKKALTAYKKAEKMVKKSWGNTHTRYAQVLTNLGLLYIGLDRNKEAIQWLSKASKIYEEKLGKNHRSFLQVETYIAQCYIFLGRLDQATTNLSRLGEGWLANLRRTSRYMDEKSKKQYLNDLDDVFSIFQSLILAEAKRKRIDTVFIRNAFDLHLEIKGFLLNDVQKIQQLAGAGKDTVISRKYEHYISLKAKIAAGITLSIEEQKQRGIDIERDIIKVQQIEKELSLKVGVNKINEQRIRFEDIRKVLKPDEAAIMVIPYKHFNPETKKEETFSFFLVVTVNTKYPKLNIMQYKTNTAQVFVKQYTQTIQSKQKDTLSYGRFWSPIATLLKNKGIKKLYFSPDGVYHQLNLNTLQNPATGKYVGEEIELHLVNNLKDIVKFKNKKTLAQANNRIELFARPAYDLPIEALKKAETAFNTQTVVANAIPPMSAQEYQSGKQTLRSGWSDLPGTEAEIRAIEKVLRTQQKYQVVTRLKDQALEKAVKNVVSPKVLHIATHGFFVENFKAPTKVQKEEVVFDNFSRGGAAMSMSALRAKITREEPMLRSGIVLAGAGSYEKALQKPNTEDGILTAYEASALDLRGTDLVTLSACETGLGEIENGEGVYGLQRAFMVAGAKSLLMSLWKVDDTATQLLMSRFYKEWIGKGKSKRAAFSAAQAYLRNYKKGGKKIYAAPYYWGAFVMVGE
jgi:CHAT domain-containing protein